MHIQYKKQAVKHISSCDKSTKIKLKEVIEDQPESDEIEAIKEAKEDNSELINHNDINWE